MSTDVVRAALRSLAERRPVFHSEADFQHALAWQLQLDHPHASVRLETRPLRDRPVFLDIALTVGGRRTAIELKYLVKSLRFDSEGELFELRPQSAHDVRRYDVIKDICRLEEIIEAGAAEEGVMIALTNDPAYWNAGRPGTIDEAFRLHEGQVLTGTVGWASHAGPGTTAKRTELLALLGSYPLTWVDFSEVGAPAGRFRALIVEVLPRDLNHPTTSGGDRNLTNPQEEGGAKVPSYEMTCRDEILDAVVALERRHGRDTFSPAEVVAEVLARGSQHPESTIRTHIVSAMCVNAPPNHAVRYPDLERVGRGQYRRLRQ